MPIRIVFDYRPNRLDNLSLAMCLTFRVEES
jgi:hypothetical protein